MEANTGNKGGQATMFLTWKLAYINLETAGREGNVPKKSGTSSVGETGVGQQGKAVHHASENILRSQ